MTVAEELLLQNIIDTRPDSSIWYEPVYGGEKDGVVDFKVRYCNASACKALRTAKEMLIGQRVSQTLLIDEATKKRTLEQCLKVWHSGVAEEFFYFHDQLGRFINVHRSKILEGILSVVRDYTDLVLSERKVKAQADLLSHILDTSLTPVFACEAIQDAEGSIMDFRFLKVNRKFLEVIGISEEEALASTYLSVFPAGKASGLFELKCQVVQTGTPLHTQFLHQSGEAATWFDLSMSRLDDKGLVVTFTDITEIKKDKESLSQSAQYLQKAIDSSQTGITVIVPEFDENREIIDFRYRVVNKTFARHVGCQPEDMAGDRLSKWFPLYKAQGTFDRYKEIYRTGQANRFDLHYVKDGYDLWVDIMAQKEGDELFVTFHDYTTLKRAQIAQENLVKDLKQSNANLEDFAFAASHDLQEPLRKIHFYSHKLRHSYFHLYNEDGINMFLRMEAAAQRMRELINDLLHYSQVSEGKKDFEWVDLNTVISDALADLETLSQEKGARFTIDVLPKYRGERPLLRQLFQNLLSNALKYSHPERPPFVSIHVKQVSGRDSGFPIPAELLSTRYYLFEITDNGIGFDQQDADKIFNVFQRLHSRDEYSGTGVGLALVKKVVDHYSGWVAAQSCKGAGSTFKVLLPVSGKVEEEESSYNKINEEEAFLTHRP